MAVVQISKIQVRRGQKYSNTGVPQLSSGEFAWAVDSQELFIGNGSIAEGAPYVGNTKILTEHDNLIDLLGGYQFAAGTFSISGTQSRSLQAKLDEYVSVLDFGPPNMGQGIIDCQPYFQRAIDELFLNADPTFKRKLVIPPGSYNFSSDLIVPTTAFIQGENKFNVVLKFGSNNLKFKSINGKVEGSFDSTADNHPNNIRLSQLTLAFTTGQFNIAGVTDSLFDQMLITTEDDSKYSFGDDISIATATMVWLNSTQDNSANRITFSNVEFKDLPFVASTTQGPNVETLLFFNDCSVNNCGKGFLSTGTSLYSNQWQFNSCTFNDLFERAYWSDYASNAQFTSCTFLNCGNGENLPTDPIYPVIEFTNGINNIVSSCSFDRLNYASFTTDLGKLAVPEVVGGDRVEIANRASVNVSLQDTFVPLAVLGFANSYIEIDYSLKISDAVRTGKLTVSVDQVGGSFSFTDNYQYASEGGVSTFDFDFVSRKNNPATPGSDPDTLVIRYQNPSATGAPGTLSFSLIYGV